MYQVRRRVATAGVAALVVVLAYHVVFGANGMLVYQKKRVEYRKLDAEIKALQQENERLTEHIGKLKSDPKTIEKEAREQFKYARPGEVVYSLPQANQQAPAAATAQNQGQKPSK